MLAAVSKSSRKDKKFQVEIGNNIIHFGGAGYEDFTTHKDPKRKERYLIRHSKNEDWSEAGILTAGFWSRWLLWNKETLRDSAKDIEKRFNIRILLLL